MTNNTVNTNRSNLRNADARTTMSTALRFLLFTLIIFDIIIAFFLLSPWIDFLIHTDIFSIRGNLAPTFAGTEPIEMTSSPANELGYFRLWLTVSQVFLALITALVFLFEYFKLKELKEVGDDMRAELAEKSRALEKQQEYIISKSVDEAKEQVKSYFYENMQDIINKKVDFYLLSAPSKYLSRKMRLDSALEDVIYNNSATTSYSKRTKIANLKTAFHFIIDYPLSNKTLALEQIYAGLEYMTKRSAEEFYSVLYELEAGGYFTHFNERASLKGLKDELEQWFEIDPTQARPIETGLPRPNERPGN